MGEKREPEYHLVTEKQDNLLSEFLKIDGQSLRAVWYVWELGSLDKVVLAFDEGSLVVEVLIDDDTVVFGMSKGEISKNILVRLWGIRKSGRSLSASRLGGVG